MKVYVYSKINWKESVSKALLVKRKEIIMHCASFGTAYFNTNSYDLSYCSAHQVLRPETIPWTFSVITISLIEHISSL